MPLKVSIYVKSDTKVDNY